MTPKSELAWKLADYRREGIEAPARILADPMACEGELMTQGEVAEFIKDSIGTLLVMQDNGSKRYDTVRQSFLADLECLLKMGKIDQDEYNEITASEELNQ